MTLFLLGVLVGLLAGLGIAFTIHRRVLRIAVTEAYDMGRRGFLAQMARTAERFTRHPYLQRLK